MELKKLLDFKAVSINNMKKPKSKTYSIGKNGWTKWVYPYMKNYKFECCNCGLVHKFEFEIFTTKGKKGEILLRFRVR